MRRPGRINRNVTARREFITWWWDLTPQTRRWGLLHPRRLWAIYRAWMRPLNR